MVTDPSDRQTRKLSQLQSHKRLGEGGRLGPFSKALRRQLAAELIASCPEASLFAIAEVAGISPLAVRNVRARLRRGKDPVRASASESKELEAFRRRRSKLLQPTSAGRGELADVSPVLITTLSKDPTLSSTTAGRELLGWLHTGAVNSTDRQKILESVPDHCLDHLIKLARRCSANWKTIADDLELRRASFTTPEESVAGRSAPHGV
jgi:hypothetical protein